MPSPAQDYEQADQHMYYKAQHSSKALCAYKTMRGQGIQGKLSLTQSSAPLSEYAL